VLFFVCLTFKIKYNMTAQENSLNWFEISVADIDRATAFYQTIFDIEMHRLEMMDNKMAMFPSDPGNGKASGCLCQSDMHIPSGDGVKLYLNGNPNLQNVLSKVEAAGGQVIMPKTAIEEFGFMAFFKDTENNVIALHSNA
jgi:predicted enzyme related to lactoylglutathione lyase